MGLFASVNKVNIWDGRMWMRVCCVVLGGIVVILVEEEFYLFSFKSIIYKANGNNVRTEKARPLRSCI